MLDAPLHLEDELGVVAICSAQQAHPPNATAIGEGEALARRVQLPPGLLALDRATVALEAWIPLFPQSPLAAVGLEALNGGPGAGGGGLAGLRVEMGGKIELVSQAGAEHLEVVRGDTPPIHPEAKGFVADELGCADVFIDRRRLGAGEAQLVLIDEHAAPPLVDKGCGHRI
jgi:hypothetical protein